MIDTIPTFMYHRICGDHPTHRSEFVVTKSVFRKQVKYLARHGYSTASLSELLAHGAGHKTAGSRTVLLTFDDGYLDNYENAFPILQEYGFTAHVFLLADWSRRRNWWDDHPAMVGAPLMERQHVVTLAAAGFGIGSHAVTHRSLPTLSDRDLADELHRSRNVIEGIVNDRVDVLAYPYGDVDERVKRAVHRAGYACAFAVNSGPFEFFTDRYEIRRLRVLDRADDAYMFTLLSGIQKTYMWGKWIGKKIVRGPA